MKPIDCVELYDDGWHYDGQTRHYVEDIPFYLRQVRTFRDPVLELACGTGRVTIPIAERGHRVTGLDVSEPMLAVAKEKAKARGVDIEWVRADCRDFSLGRRYAFVLLPFNSISHLHDLASLEACFRRVQEHLAEGGRFVIDMFNPRLGILLRDPSRRYPVVEYDDPDGRGVVTITESNVYDAASQVNRIKWNYQIGGRSERTVENNMRIFFPQELDALLRYNGFSIEAKYGDYEETPFGSNSSKQIVVCRSQGDH